MLRGLRKASSNWLGKSIMAVVVGVLVISFAIWGIGDIFKGFGRSTVAKIGRTEVSIEQFRQLYTERLQLVSRQVGRPLTLDQARALGVDRQIVRQLFGEMVLDEYARLLGLGVSDAEIARRIRLDPSFQGLNGQFDRQRFEQLLRQNSYTELRYVADQRRGALRRQISGTVIGPGLTPKAEVEAADRYSNEQRAIEYVLIDRSQAGEIPPPSPEAIAEYFEQRKSVFRAPEYRKVAVIALLPREQARWIEISDADLKRAFAERRARYITPERRAIQQIVFPSAAEAGAASDRVAKGETFDAIAKERSLTEKDIDLGMVTKASMIDRAVADAAFALKEGEVSSPLQGRFGTVLVRVLTIEPEKTPAYEELADQIRIEIANERAKAEVLSIYDKIEDERSLGKSLAEIAEKFKLEVRTAEIDRSGRDPAGVAVTNLPEQQRVLPAAFAAEIGADSDPLQVDGGYVWYEVTGIAPERERRLDEVKEQVEARWREDEMAGRLRAKAAQMLDKIKAGAPLVAAAAGLKVENKADIKRNSPAAPLSARAVDLLFRTPKGEVASGEAEQAGEQVVFRVTDIVLPTVNFDSEETVRLRTTLNGAMSDDLFGEFIALIEREVGVTINERALRQVLSGQSINDDN